MRGRKMPTDSLEDGRRMGKWDGRDGPCLTDQSLQSLRLPSLHDQSDWIWGQHGSLRPREDQGWLGMY